MVRVCCPFEVVCTGHGGSSCLAAVPLSTVLHADDEVFPFYELRAAAVDLRSGEAYVRCCVGHCYR